MAVRHLLILAACVVVSCGGCDTDGTPTVTIGTTTVLADEIRGATIVWDSVAEQFTVQGDGASPGSPNGRVRAVLSPREVASGPAAGASAGAAPLRSTPSLGARN